MSSSLHESPVMHGCPMRTQGVSTARSYGSLHELDGGDSHQSLSMREGFHGSHGPAAPGHRWGAGWRD